jgi:type VI secretion system protein ImpB
MSESAQSKLTRVRSPRVHITYEVEKGDAIEVRDLPFVMGVLADLSGHANGELPALRERSFVEVTPDNFDEVLAKASPTLNLTVDDTLSGESGARLPVSLAFESLDDFSPDGVVRQVAPLAELLAQREKLAGFRNRLQGNPTFGDILQKTLDDTASVARLKRETAGPEGNANG